MVDFTPLQEVGFATMRRNMKTRTPIKPHAPNELQMVPLALIAPSENNCRLFIETESLESLEIIYGMSLLDPENTVLPDPPVIRFMGRGQLFELLAGHRRITGATNVGVEALPCRVVTMTDEEAYRFIRQANNYETLTNIEKAFAVAEMDRLGFPHSDIREVMGNIGVSRYITVGKLVNPDLFSDVEKQCDPSITLWHYAVKNGLDHFQHCFDHWNSGAWDDDECAKNFRRRGRVGGGEVHESGIRVSVDSTGTLLRFRGTVDLHMMTPAEIEEQVVGPFIDEFLMLVQKGVANGNFGQKGTTVFLPEE